MSNAYQTQDTEQHVLNDAKDATYGTIDVTPMLETTVGSVAERATATKTGTKVAQDVCLATGSSRIGQVVPVDSSDNELTDNKRLVAALMATSGGSLYNALAYNATISGYIRASIEAWNSGLGAFEVMNHREQVWKGTTTAGTNISTTANTVLRGFAVGGTIGTKGWTGSIYFVNASSGTTAATVTFTDPLPGWFEYPMLFSTALRVVISATSGTPDVTVHYVN